MDLNNILNGTHILIVDDKRMSRTLLSAMFQALGATIHRKPTQMQAIGEYFRMYKSQQLPRCVITDWWLKDTDDDSYKMLKRCNGIDMHATSAMLLDTINDLDKESLAIVYTEDYRNALRGIKKHFPQAELVTKRISPSDLVLRVINHPKLLSQSIKLTEEQKESVLDYLNKLSTEALEQVYIGTQSSHPLHPTL